MKKQVALHRGHRRRMRHRYRMSGRMIETFSDHEMIEMLLFRTIKRSNTNETAHRLLKHFGCIWEILRAERRELIRIAGIGTETASLLRLYGAVMGYIYSNTRK